MSEESKYGVPDLAGAHYRERENAAIARQINDESGEAFPPFGVAVRV